MPVNCQFTNKVLRNSCVGMVCDGTCEKFKEFALKYVETLILPAPWDSTHLCD